MRTHLKLAAGPTNPVQLFTMSSRAPPTRKLRMTSDSPRHSPKEQISGSAASARSKWNVPKRLGLFRLRRRSRSVPGYSGRRRRSQSRRLVRRIRSGIKRIVVWAFVLVVLGAVALTAIHWSDGAAFESAFRMMTDDFRLLVACPTKLETFSDFVDRGTSVDGYTSMSVRYGDDWAGRPCGGELSGDAWYAASVPATPPHLRHLDLKLYMLELINAERVRAGLDVVVLGDNVAAQLHADAALQHCFSAHWGIDGLKPYMRYSLAGGYQSNAENGHGSDYCVRWGDGYRRIYSIEHEIREAMTGLMSSPGHRRNILDRWHKKVNIGLAWDTYNFAAYQHFEGDYVEYIELPRIEGGRLVLSGRLKNGVRLEGDDDLVLQIYYDPPPHALTRGQLSRTYCYGSGRPIASLRPSLTGNSHYTEHAYEMSLDPCPDPYEVSPDAPAPRSNDEAHEFWREAYEASQSLPERSFTVPWVAAEGWIASGEEFSVSADLGELLNEYGGGVRTNRVFQCLHWYYVIYPLSACYRC